MLRCLYHKESKSLFGANRSPVPPLVMQGCCIGRNTMCLLHCSAIKYSLTMLWVLALSQISLDYAIAKSV